MDRSAVSRLWWPFPLVVALHLAVAFGCIRHGALNPDEGFYAAAARAVWEGALPYRDFGYTQPPLLPYLNGLPMQLTGFGLFEQRSVNGVWTLLTLGLTGVLIARRTSVTVAAGCILLFSLSAPWMYFIHLGKTYALTSLLTVLASWAWLECAPGWRKAALLGVIGVVGTGCRLPAGPFFALLWLATLAEKGTDRRDRRAIAALAVLLPAAGALLLPFYLAAPDNAVFWVIDFHRVSVPLKSWHLAWQEIVTLAPALWVATAIAIMAPLIRLSSVGRELARASSSASSPAGPPRTASPADLTLGAASLATLLCNLLPGGVYEEYAVPFLAPLAIPVAAALHRFAAGRGRKFALTLTGALILIHVAAAPVVLWRDFPTRRLTVSQWLTPNAPAFNPALPAQLAAARRVVEAVLPPDQPLIGPNLILALEAGRPVPPSLIMGPFSINSTLPAAEAQRRHLAPPAAIDGFLADPAVPLLAFFPQSQLNYGWTVPTFERLPEAIVRRWVEIYRRDFVIVYQEGNFLLLARPGSLPNPPSPP